MLYSCGLCGKGYRSAKDHAHHLNSKAHLLRASQVKNHQIEDNAVIRPLVWQTPVRPPIVTNVDSDESEDSEWEEVDPEEDMVDEAANSLNMNGTPADAVDTDVEVGFEEDLDPSCCFMCDKENPTLEACMVHMHKKHGFFIPDTENFKDPKGLLTYLGIKLHGRRW